MARMSKHFKGFFTKPFYLGAGLCEMLLNAWFWKVIKLGRPFPLVLLEFK
jgi:hypothetical protein